MTKTSSTARGGRFGFSTTSTASSTARGGRFGFSADRGGRFGFSSTIVTVGE